MLSAFRRSLKAETKKMGKGGRGAWRERWRLPQNNPTPILFINASYIDPNPAQEQIEIDPQTGRPKEVRNAFFKAKKHRRRVMRNGTESWPDEWCSAGHDPHNPQPCFGCYHMDKGDKSISLNDVFMFGVVHLAPYHSHPVLDDKGQIMMSKSQQGGPVLNYSECTWRNCNYCRTLAGAPLVADQNWPGWHANQIGTIFGQRRYLEIGKGHLSNLDSWDNTLSSSCAQCGSTISTEGFKCPYCAMRLIDMSTDPRTDEQIQEAVAQPYPCMNCNTAVQVVEEVVCETCLANNNGTGMPFPFFGTVIHALREGEGTKSQMVLRRFEHPGQFERTMMGQQLMFGASIGQVLQGKSIMQRIEELAQPYDFPEIAKPRELKDQQKRLGEDLALPNQPQNQSQYRSTGNGANGAYLPYGQQNQGGGQQQGQLYGGQQNNQQQNQGNWDGNRQQNQGGFQNQNGGQQQGFQGNNQNWNNQQQGGQQQGFQPGPQPFQPMGRPHFGN